jgi:hypothetical protein
MTADEIIAQHLKEEAEKNPNQKAKSKVKKDKK